MGGSIYNSNRYNSNSDPVNETHIFAQTTFSNYVELTNLLKNNIIYFKNGLLVLNRPYGLKKDDYQEKSNKKKINIATTPASEKINHLSFTGVLEYLKDALNVSDLNILKAPDRYVSGISILQYDETVEKGVHKAFLPVHLPIYTYLAICIGNPVKNTDSAKLGVTMKKNDKSSKVVFLNTYSKRSVKKSNVYPFIMQHKLLAHNEELNVSLIELQNNRNKWNAIRAYCALRLLAPILGDNIYGSCTKTIKSVKIAVDPLSPAANMQPKIPQNILSSLEIETKQQSIIPLHLHLAQLNFIKHKIIKGLFVAKPAVHFLWTCEKLRLCVPEYYMTNRVVHQSTDIKPSFMIDTYSDNNNDEQIPLVDVNDDVKKSIDVNNNILEHDDGYQAGVLSEDSKNIY